MSIPIDLKEWETTTFTTHSELAGMALPEDDATQAHIQALSRQEKLIISQLRKGVVLEASSFVGRVAIGSLQITIRPKIDMLPLLRLMQYAYKLRHLELFSDTSFNTESLAFQDVLVYQLVAETSELLSRGLHRKYVRREESLSSPRGRIALQTIARQGGVMQASLPCIYYPRMEDCLINQILLQGILLALHLTDNPMLRTHLLQLANFHLPNITPIRLDQHTLERLHREMDRLVEAYKPAITLIEILLAGEGMSLDELQADLLLPSFLFDMNIFFQELLARFLSEYLEEFTVETQFELKDMMVYIDNPRMRQTPRPRPDYVVKQDKKIVAILDAKYRDLWEHSLPPHMLYQLVIYALGHESCNTATILYPTIQSDAREARIEVRIPTHSKGHVSVILRPVNLCELDTLLTNAEKKRTIERERKTFARKLAFGADGL